MFEIMFGFSVSALLDAALSVALTAATLAFTNGVAGQHWSFWPVFGFWLILLGGGMVAFCIADRKKEFYPG